LVEKTVRVAERSTHTTDIIMNDTTYDALADERRRDLLIGLLDENPQSDGVGVPDGTSASRNPDAGHRDRVELYHVHLPKLVASGLVEWHQEASEVVKGPQFDEVRPVLELAAGQTVD
jgi:hypothetical protein